MQLLNLRAATRQLMSSIGQVFVIWPSTNVVWPGMGSIAICVGAWGHRGRHLRRAFGLVLNESEERAATSAIPLSA